MKRRQIAFLAVLLLTSCGHEPPAYDSKYTTPATSTIAPVSTAARPMEPLPAQGSFIDRFDRPDTERGLGEGWDMRGARNGTALLPPATDGFIRDGRYTYAGTGVVYAVRKFDGVVRGMGAVGSFRKIGDGEETTLGMGISPNDGITRDILLLTANRRGWTVRTRRADGPLEPVMSGRFVPELDVDVNYQFTFDVTGDTLVARVPGAEVTRVAAVGDLLGTRAFWLESVGKPLAGVVFDFDTVWAVEDGRPLISVGP